jgi:hypothetical protein
MNDLTQVTVPYNFIPRFYQQRFYESMDSGCKRYFMRWTRRSGKDLTAWNFVIKSAFSRVGNYYYVFPNYTQGKKAIWEGKTKHGARYLDFIPPGWARFNSNEMRVDLANGSIIRIVGSDNIDALRGAGACGIVISEFAWQSMQVIEVLEPMLMENGGWLVINSTPQGKNFMYDFENTISNDPNWIVDEIQSLWPDLPHYYPVMTTTELDDAFLGSTISLEQYLDEGMKQTSSAIENLRLRGATEDYIEQEYGVSYIAGQKGAYYADQIKKAREDGRIGKFCHLDNKPVDVLLDLGRTDDTVIWFRQYDGNHVNWIDYYENNTQDLMHYVNVLKEKNYTYRVIVLPHDARQHNIQTNMSTENLLSRLLLEARLNCSIIVAEKPASKQIPIMLTRERFSKYHFDEKNCYEGIKKVSLYHREYDKKANVFKETPAHDWCSHAADALALDGVVGSKLDSYSSYRESSIIITDFDPFNWK